MRNIMERFKKMPAAARYAIIFILLALAVWVPVRAIFMQNREEKEPVPAVKADHRVIAEGVVLPIRYADLAFASSGVVAEILVKEGEMVETGQVLARLENRGLSAELETAEAELAQATANLNEILAGNASRDIELNKAKQEEAQADYELSSADYERYQTLYEQGGVSLQELEEARVASVKAEARLKQARVELEMARARGPEAIASARAERVAAEAGVEASAARLAQSELQAPFSGMIAAIDLRTGEAVPACTPLIHLADCSEWQIKTEDLSELDIARVKKGSAASIRLDAVPGLVLPARVVHIRALGEKKRGDMTYTVTLKPEKHDSRLYWNMKALVKIGEPENGSDR